MQKHSLLNASIDATEVQSAAHDSAAIENGGRFTALCSSGSFGVVPERWETPSYDLALMVVHAPQAMPG
jgi:hypothetical protein